MEKLNTKICKNCKIEKDISLDFPKNKNTKDGFARMCKKCNNEAYKRYYDKNKDSVKQKYYDNKSAYKERAKKYKEANPEKIKEQGRRYREGLTEEQKKSKYFRDRERIKAKRLILNGISE